MRRNTGCLATGCRCFDDILLQGRHASYPAAPALPARRFPRLLLSPLAASALRPCRRPRGHAGGFTTGEMTELAGPSGAGKTQICLAAAVNVAR